MNDNNPNDPVKVFSGTQWQAGIVQSILADSEIDAFIQDLTMGTINPLWSPNGELGSVKVFVARKDYSAAKSLIDEYEKNLLDS